MLERYWQRQDKFSNLWASKRLLIFHSLLSPTCANIYEAIGGVLSVGIDNKWDPEKYRKSNILL
jgi:hypothetical protein